MSLLAKVKPQRKPAKAKALDKVLSKTTLSYCANKSRLVCSGENSI